MTALSNLVTELRSLLTAEIGLTLNGRPAIGVAPDQIARSPNGMTVMVMRAPNQGRGSGKVTGGTYHEDLYKVVLLNPTESNQITGASAKLIAAKRKIENRFNVWSSAYVEPEGELLEQAHLDIFSPVIES